MDIRTYYSSFAFGVVSWMAQYTPQRLIHFCFHSMFGLSVLNHGKYYEQFAGKDLMILLDKIIVHVTVAVSVYVALTMERPQPLLMFIFWGCLTWIAMVYYVFKLSFLPGTEWEPWHATVHFGGSIGEIALLGHYFLHIL
jgi:hypothetical protein